MKQFSTNFIQLFFIFILMSFICHAMPERPRETRTITASEMLDRLNERTSSELNDLSDPSFRERYLQDYCQTIFNRGC